MPDYDPSAPPSYNSMQQQMGLLPPIFQPPAVPFPGQVSAAMSQGGTNGAFMTAGSPGTSFGAGMFPAQQLQGFTNQSPMLQGPTGIMMPMNAGAAFNPYAAMNPYAGLGARGPYQGPPGLFSPLAPAPPPMYSGQPGQYGLGVPPPAAQFNTQYMADLERHQLAEDNAYSRNWSVAGMGARLGGNAMGGLAGAALGRRMGLGMPGMVLGGLAGFMGMELSGGGQFMQNAFMNNVAAPFLQQRALTGGIEEMSRGFINSGSGLHAGGAGFSHHAAAQVASGLQDLSKSASFNRETGDRFNMHDLARIAQEAGRNDMFTGVQSPGQMTARVRDIAKSLTSFMELAQEPDIQRAIQTMGQLRASGLNLSETQQAVAQGRTFARMAGTSFSDLSAMAGSAGSQTYQAMGLTQGLGLQSGMMNYALARGGQNAGIFSPQLMNLVGGAQGLANMNNMFGASMLQMPMLAPSVMSSSGGVNIAALQNLVSGNTNAFGQTSSATAALQGITGRQGIGGIGAAIAMQPMMQDLIGRTLQAQGPFAQRNFEDRNILNTMRQMGLSGSGGFLTMAQTLGMDRNQAMARLQEMGSPGYFEGMRAQIDTTRADERATEIGQREAMAPSMFGTLTRSIGIEGGGALSRRIGRGFRGLFGLDHHSHFSPENDMDRRRDLAMIRSGGMASFERGISEEADRLGSRDVGFFGRLRDRYRVSEGRGYGGIAGVLDSAIDYQSDAQLDSNMRDLREGSRMTGLLASTSRRERDRTTSGMAGEFGADRAMRIQQEMSANLAVRFGEGNGMGPNLRNFVNLGARTGLAAAGFVASGGVGTAMMAADVAGITDGNLFNTRQVTGADYRTMFIRAAQRQGASREQAEAFYARDPSAAIQPITTRLRETMTLEQENAFYEQAQRSQGLGAGRGAEGRALETRENQARDRMFGSHSAELQDEFQHQLGNIRGVSREGSSEQEAERRYVMGRAMLMQQVSRVGADSDEGRNLLRQANQMESIARSRNIKVDELQDQTLAASRRMREGVGRDMTRAFVAAHMGQTGEQTLDAVGEFDQTANQTRVTRRIQGGFRALAAGAGPLARALQSAGAGDTSTANTARTMEALKGLGEDELRQLDPEMRSAVERLQQGRGGAEDDLRAIAYGRGQRRESLGREYYEKHGIISRSINRLFGGGEEEYINQQMGRTTEADERADQNTAQVGTLQALKNSLGIGTADDAMLGAATELRRAAELINGAATSGAFENLLSRTQ